MKISSANKLLALTIVVFTSTAFQAPKQSGRSDFLWNVVNQECVPNQKATGNPAPCAEVSFLKDDDRGYVIYKDRHGPLQYLLLPTTKIAGIESPDILLDDSPNYFYLAWKARSHMEKLYNAPIPDDEISLAINSQRGRSQNQLHIHISCVRQDVKAKIQKNLKSIGEVWKKIPGGLLGHKYFARRITLEQLKDQNAFQLLSNDLAHSKDSMKKFGLGLVVIKNEAASFDYILLADRMKIWTEDLGHVEEIQDHKCPQLIK